MSDATHVKHSVFGFGRLSRGMPKRSFKLGLLYHQGVVKAPTESIARYWWGKAAEQGHAEAQQMLGMWGLKPADGLEID